MEYAES